MTTRTIFLSVHITAVASWLGADVAQHAMRHRWRNETSEVAAAWARMQHWLHHRYYVAVAALITASGFGLVQDGSWSWSSTFIWLGIGTILSGATLGGVALKALAEKRATALAAHDDATAASADRRSVPIELALTTLVLVAVVAMVAKWGA